jgi:membrane-associated phospholipid phosphatase
MDLLRAQLIAGALTFALKEAVRRERPDGSNNQSFPSGHAALTFASATALQRHVGWEWSLPLFLIASYTAASRLHENVHYLSDVVFGATVGVIAGRTVTRHGRTSYALVPVWTHGVAAVMVQRTF